MASTDAQREFLERNGAKLPPRPEPSTKSASPRSSLARKTELKSKRRPRQESDKQAVRNAWLAGIKAERITHQLLTEGEASCSQCPESWTTFAAAKGHLDLHHTEKRARGPRYEPGKMGVDAPGSLILVCRSCHRHLEESEPQWTKGEAS